MDTLAIVTAAGIIAGSTAGVGAIAVAAKYTPRAVIERITRRAFTLPAFSRLIAPEPEPSAEQRARGTNPMPADVADRLFTALDRASAERASSKTHAARRVEFEARRDAAYGVAPGASRLPGMDGTGDGSALPAEGRWSA